MPSINPHIGTGERGNCLIGPCLPFGLVKIGPDIRYPQPNSGYRPGKPIIGFSHTHIAGTGGAARYGNIRIMPLAKPPRQIPVPPFYCLPATNSHWSIPTSENASLGEYRCQFKNGISVALTCTRHVGIHRYHFPQGSNPQLLLDISAILQAGTAPAGQAPYAEDWELEGCCRAAEVCIADAHTLYGWAEHQGGWGHLERNRVYFYLRSRTAFLNEGIVNQDGVQKSRTGSGSLLRTLLSFSSKTVELEVGISFHSIDQAKHAVENESAGRDFASIREDARKAWQPWIQRIEVEGGNLDQQTFLKTSLLRLFTQPVDLRGDGGSGLTDICCLWDSIRNANSLQHLIAPEFSADLMNSLLDNADSSGWLPDAHLAGHTGYQQSGCCAEILFSEAARKGVAGVDYRRALLACQRNAETPSPDPRYYGRYLDDYEQLGYLTTNVPKGAVNRHIEYSYQDWCIARLAEHLGQPDMMKHFDTKARRLWNLWHPEKRLFLPRDPSGDWIPVEEPETQSWDGWNDPYAYESSLAHWSFCGLHDITGLIERHGSPKAFSHHLDGFLARHPKIEKETRMILPHLYAFAGRPDRTAHMVANSLRENYLNHPDGMPDDEDMGCQSAYYICNSIGLYPIYGQTLYSLVPPVFEKSLLHYGESGKELEIRRKGEGSAIQSIRINGRTLESTLIEHQAIEDGGILEITVS
ncbi:GH92 family glycosyl hydrolase [Coraliomargarita parva]|uniref:GH92 family glycosyl hydrolase n=1 Tax=Coraliomargarita parva TaxID=3014050 RepID=UPI0022B35DE0|nr:GH92 family glycosyl hydrolase [Coraliomargarita parva]